MSARLALLAALVLSACGAEEWAAEETREPAPPELVSGGCRYRSHEATCAFDGVDAFSPETGVATVAWQASVGGARCTEERRVQASELDALIGRLRDGSPVPCAVELETDGSCPPVGACTVRAPP